MLIVCGDKILDYLNLYIPEQISKTQDSWPYIAKLFIGKFKTIKGK